MLLLFFFILIFLTSCVEVGSSSRSKVYVERPSESTVHLEATKPTSFQKVPAKDYLELKDNSELVLSTLQLDVIVKNPSDKGIVLTKLCTRMYGFFDNLIKEDVWFMVALIGSGGEKHLKRNIYTEPTQSKIPKTYEITVCGAEYGESISS